MAGDRGSSFLQGQGLQSIAANDTLLVERKNKGHTRFTFMISNINAAGGAIFYICSTDGQEAIPVFPQTTVQVDSDTVFKLKNPNGAPITAVIGETFGITIGNPGAPGGSGSGGGGGGGSGNGGYAGGGGGGGYHQPFLP